MGLYEVTAEAGLPVAVEIASGWQLHTRPGAVVEVTEEMAAALGASLRRLDVTQQPVEPVEPVEPDGQVEEQPPARASRRRGADPGGDDG